MMDNETRIAGNGKVTKEHANYTPFGSEDTHCSICKMFREPNSCTKVLGGISRTAVCDFWDGRSVGYKRVPLQRRG
jgi:hypothetical protein